MLAKFDQGRSLGIVGRKWEGVLLGCIDREQVMLDPRGQAVGYVGWL